MQTIGRYKLQEKLGEGGMGVVYRAYDPLIDRTIAVKLISASMEGNVDLRERFFREARAAGQLSHRNIITIHDLGEHEGQPYLAMEFLEGQDLQRRLSRGGPMTLNRKLELAIGICEGLEYAHGRGVVHRDIKPANMFITDNGTVKILDFGLARMITSQMTQSNTLMGTLNYMAPEQVRGERADHRSDIFSTGVMFYELLGGRKAFEADSVAATLYKILEVIPEPLQQLDASLPPEVTAVVDRALAKSREERYQNMGEMLRDLMVARHFLTAAAALSAGAPTVEIPRPSSNPGTLSVPPAGAVAVGSDVSAGAATVFVPPIPSPSSAPGPPTPVPAGGAPSTAPASTRALIAAAVAAILIVGGFALAWLTLDPATGAVNPPATESAGQAAAQDQPQNAAALARASQLLGAGDYQGARREAEGVLARVSDDPEARRIRDRALETANTVQTGLQDAREHHRAGRFEEAARAAGSVLTVAPGNTEAKQLMEDSASRTRGRGAEDARVRMAQAKAAAASAKAATLAAAVYAAGVAAEQEGLRLSKAGRPGDAMAKFYEASGLFHSAELGARNEAAAGAQRARAANPAPEQRPPTPEVPQPGVSTSKPVAPDPIPPAPASAPVTAPPAQTQNPAPPPPATATPDSAAAHSPEQAAREVLARYEAAIEARSLDALKRIWPTLGGAQLAAFSREFEHASDINMEVRDPSIAISGATATVTFVRHYEMRTVEGQRQRADTRTVMKLRRAGNDWVIEDIRFEPTR